MDEMLTKRKTKGDSHGKGNLKRRTRFVTNVHALQQSWKIVLFLLIAVSQQWYPLGSQYLLVIWMAKWLNEWMNETPFPVSRTKLPPTILQSLRPDESYICTLSDFDMADKQKIQSHIHLPGPSFLRKHLASDIDLHLELESQAQMPSAASQII